MRKAMVIGAGSIGAMKPDAYDYPGGKKTLTVAHALWNNEEIDLEYIVDTDPKKAKAAA